MPGKLPKLDLNITNRCNFRCTHCAFNSGVKEIDELSLEELEKILRETKELGGQRIDVTGGEPTIRQDYKEIIKTAKKMDYKVELITNASLIDEKSIAELREIGLDQIAVSIDGSDYATHARIRRVDKDTYRKLLEITRNISDSGFYTKVNTVVFSSNMHDMANISNLAEELGAKEHGIYYFTPVGRGESSKELSAEPLSWLNYIRNKLADKKIKLSVEVPIIEEDSELQTCCIAESKPYHFQILPDGSTYPCAIMSHYSKEFGNLRTCSIKSLWNNESIWRSYWKDSMEPLFKKYNSCVDYSASFDINKYKNYRFVCPLRKYSVGELLG